MQIRTIKDDDFPFLMRIERASCDRDGVEWNQQQRESIIRGFIKDDSKFGLIAAEERTPLGLILARVRSTSDSDVAEYHRPVVIPQIGPGTLFVDIWDLWVHPDHRRKGIATSLKEELEREGSRREARWIFTFQRPDNSAAIEMNRKLLYQEIGTHVFWDERPFLCFCEEAKLMLVKLPRQHPMAAPDGA